MPRSIELRDDWARTLSEARVLVDRAETENRSLNAEEGEQWQRAMEVMKGLEERIKRQEYLEDHPLGGDEERHVWDLKRDQTAGPPKSEEEAAERGMRAYRDSFLRYMLVGKDEMNAEQRAILTGPQYRTRNGKVEVRVGQEVQQMTTGGFWVPDEMMKAVEQALLFYGGMRSVADIITTDTGADLPWPVYDDTGNTGRLLTEGDAVARVDITVNVRTMKAAMYTSDLILMSFALMQDAPLMSESLIAQALGERIGRITNTHFTSYAGPNGPQGLITATTVGVTAAATGAVTADELQRLQFAVPVAYRTPRLRYMMHDNTYRDCLQLKDGNGNYLFMPDPRGDLNGVSLWGKPVTINNDMPTMATGVIAIECGDFSHYKIRDVRGFTLLRLNELYAANLQVGFFGFSRHDGGYINAGQNPIVHLVMA